MSLRVITTRILKLKSKILNIRCMQQDRPPLRFSSNPNSLVYNRLEDKEDWQQQEGVGAMGYCLISIPIVAFILGTWQIERKQWKDGLVKDLKARTTAPPKPLPVDLSELEQMEYTPVIVRGQYLYDKEFAVGPKSLIKDGAGASERGSGLMSTGATTGWYVITPFKVEGRDTIILVNRGWIRQKPNKLKPNELGHVPGTVEITGLVRLTEIRQPLMPKNKPNDGLWFNRDIHAMAERVGADPVFIDLIGQPTPGAPYPGQTKISLRNEHLAYIITWYTLSILTALMWHRLFIKKLPLL